MRRTAVWLLLTPIIALAAGTPTAAAQPQPGDLAVVDIQAGTNQRGAVFLVNPVTGIRRLLSDLGNAGQGPVARQAYSLAVGPGGDFFVVDRRGGTDCTGFGSGCGALLRVDRVTGARTLVSDFGVEQPGPPPDLGISPFDIALEDSGQFLVTDPGARAVINQNLAGVLFRVDPGTGARTPVSDFTNLGQGPQGARPSGLAVSGGHALVTDPFLGVLFRVDRGTGVRTVLSDFDDPAQGPVAPFPVPIAVTPDINNQVLVVDQLGDSSNDGLGLLWSVDGSTGFRKVVSDFTTPAQGPIAFNLSAVKLDAANRILVLDFDSGTNFLGALYDVDRATGQRDCVSDFGSAAQGPLGREPSGLAVVPGVRPPGLALAAAVLPTSRSVQVGQTATAFVSIINTGSSTAKAVGIPLRGCTIPATISYQTTDPSSNALTGTVNTPVDIPPGATQTFVVAITPTQAFGPTDAAFSFGGDNTAAVAKVIGLNTLLLSGSAAPVPDVVALAATVNNDGIVNLPGNTGTGFFSVATVNVGASAAITVSADTGSAVLPVNILICQTDPGTGVCQSPPAPAVDTAIDAGTTPTFAVFVTGKGSVPFDPAGNRIFLRFKGADNATRGATSVAVRSQ